MISYSMVAVIAGLALVDSINPSAIAMTTYILTLPDTTKLKNARSYLLGVFSTYFFIGVIVLLGLETFIPTMNNFLKTQTSYYLQAAIGIILFIWAFLPVKELKGFKTDVQFPNSRSFFFKFFSLGMAITLAELITAAPYFGALLIMQQANSLISILILLCYNLIFIFPPFFLCVLYFFNRERFERWINKNRKKNKKRTNETAKWIAGVIGVILVLDSLKVILNGMLSI